LSNISKKRIDLECREGLPIAARSCHRGSLEHALAGSQLPLGLNRD